jgi:hypothetical protein
MLPSPTTKWHPPRNFFPVLEARLTPFTPTSTPASPVPNVPVTEAAAIAVTVKEQDEGEGEAEAEEQKPSTSAATKKKPRRQLPPQAGSILKGMYRYLSRLYRAV